MAKKKINKKKEDNIQKKFSRGLEIPEGQVRARHLKQEDKELVLDKYEPVDVEDANKRVIKSDLDLLDKRYENIEFGDAINQQRVSNKRQIRRTIDEQIDVVECHIYDTDDNLLKSTLVKKGEGWHFLNEIEKTFNKDTGKQSDYDRVILEPHKTLRRLNFTRGTYRVHYNFHRNRLGSDYTFYIDPEAETGYRRRLPELVKPDRVLKQDDGSIVIKNKAGTPSDRYLKTYQKKLFIQEISPSRTEVRALPVSAFTQVLNNKFRREFSGKKRNFELFDRQCKN